MNPPSQFGSAKPVKSEAGMTCAQCEARLPDWLDDAAGGTLTAKDRSAFDLHIATCPECREMLADAHRGAALLEVLKSPRPEPSAALLERILAATSGTETPSKSRAVALSALDHAQLNYAQLNHAQLDRAQVERHSVVPASQDLSPAVVPLVSGGLSASNILPFRPAVRSRFSLRSITHTMMQPRLAMTAAMAFFSIALTLNLTGVRLNELRISDLRPSSLRRTFYQADASVVRYYDNLRVVYELESRVQEMKRSDDEKTNGPVAQPNSGSGDPKDQQKSQQRKPQPKAGSGTSQRRNPFQQNFKLAAMPRFNTSPSGRLNETFALAGFLDRRTVLRTYKLKDWKQEGVLA